jgi:hypothetical protein
VARRQSAAVLTRSRRELRGRWFEEGRVSVSCMRSSRAAVLMLQRASPPVEYRRLRECWSVVIRILST